MFSKIRSGVSYANVMATLALFVALGGGAYAASKFPSNSVGAKQLKANAVNSSKVADGSLLAADFKAGQLPTGAQGIQGPRGDPGQKGDNGTDGTNATLNGVAAGGSLTGTYPNPTIKTGAIDHAMLNRVICGMSVPTGTGLLEESCHGAAEVNLSRGSSAVGIYCFKLPFVPTSAVVSMDAANSGYPVGYTTIKPSSSLGCGTDNVDAAVTTYSSAGGPLADEAFQVIFIG